MNWRFRKFNKRNFHYLTFLWVLKFWKSINPIRSYAKLKYRDMQPGHLTFNSMHFFTILIFENITKKKKEFYYWMGLTVYVEIMVYFHKNFIRLLSFIIIFYFVLSLVSFLIITIIFSYLLYDCLNNTKWGYFDMSIWPHNFLIKTKCQSWRIC